MIDKSMKRELTEVFSKIPELYAVWENVDLSSRYEVVFLNVDIEDEQHTIVQVDFLSVEDAIAAKLYAGRQKDLSYIAAVKQHFDVDASQLMDSIGELEPDFEQFTCLLALYDAL